MIMRSLLFIRPAFESRSINPDQDNDPIFVPIPGEYILGAQAIEDQVAEGLEQLQKSLAEKCIELSIIEPDNLVDPDPWKYAGIKSGNGRMVPVGQIALLADLNNPPIPREDIVELVANTASEANCMPEYRGVIDMVYGESYEITSPE